jgi:proteic killer suppression protein
MPKAQFIGAASLSGGLAFHTARQLNDLRAPPANRLEALTGSRRGQYSIRINDQWRICFTWTKEGPADVEIVDYH